MAYSQQLLGTWSSPFSLRIVWALRLKGIDYEYLEEDLSNKSPLLLEYNPIYKKVPVLVHNGKPVVESAFIAEYMDETWEQNPLLPTDPYERAIARFWVKFVDDKFMSSIWNSFAKEEKEQEEHCLAAKENLKLLEEEIKGKKFFGGEAIGLVDIFVGSVVNLSNVLDEITGLNTIDEERHPFLSAWMEHFLMSKIIVDALPPRDKLILRIKAIREYLRSNATI